MATFFSSTDNSTLVEEGMDTCHFLSLIVNNAGTYSARITRKVAYTTVGITTSQYTTFEETEESNEKDSTQIEEILEAFNLNIVKEVEEKDLVAEEVANRFAEIKKAKEEERLKKASIATSPTLFSYGGGQMPINPASKGVYPSNYFSNISNKKEEKEEEKKEEVKSVIPSYNLWKDPSGDWHIPTTLASILAAQLIYGSILINNKTVSKLNFVDWIKNKMIPAFNSRFETIKDYEFWLDTYCETVIGKVWCNYDLICSAMIDDDDLIDICARDVYKYIESASNDISNIYISEILEAIKEYIIPTDEDFEEDDYKYINEK